MCPGRGSFVYSTALRGRLARWCFGRASHRRAHLTARRAAVGNIISWSLITQLPRIRGYIVETGRSSKVQWLPDIGLGLVGPCNKTNRLQQPACKRRLSYLTPPFCHYRTIHLSSVGNLASYTYREARALPVVHKGSPTDLSGSSTTPCQRYRRNMRAAI